MGTHRFPSGRIAAAVALLLLPCLLLWRALFGMRAFVPADLLACLSPWKAGLPADAQPPWNVLRFDGVAEFYPWRLIAARSFHAGRVPLWNEFAFGATGGIPLLANSQSAPLYPPNLLFWLMPEGALWYAFGLSAALHLALLAAGMYRLLRAEGRTRLAGVFGAATVTLSAPVVTWLALPTFVNVAAWVPWLLLLIGRAHDLAGTRAGRFAALGAGAVAGTMLLAGHLQMAFYGLLAGGLYALWRGALSWRAGAAKPMPWLAGVVAAGGVAVLLALAQLLPAVELSRVSHRAAAGPPNTEGYAAYVANALPIRNLVTFLVPDFFGHPARNGGFYWNTNNYAEWAVYVGVAPLLLACVALFLPWRGAAVRRGFYALLLAISLLLAFGTPLNLPFFFLIPGYSQTGNPGRILILAAFALATLAAEGLDALRTPALPRTALNRAVAAGVVAAALAAAAGASAAARFASEQITGVAFGDLMTAALPGIQVAALLTAVAAVALAAVPRFAADRQRAGAAFLVVLAVADLTAWGHDYNAAVPPGAVFAQTPGIRYLRDNAAPDDLVAPINRGWSLGNRAPQRATLPPNTLAVYGLHDLQGYDSLLPASAKDRLREAGGEDPSPPENGNMAFVKSAESARALGARFLVVAPDAPEVAGADLRPAYAGDDLRVYEFTGSSVRPFDPQPGRAYRPTSFRFGLFAGLCAAGILAAAAGGVVSSGGLRRGSRPTR